MKSRNINFFLASLVFLFFSTSMMAQISLSNNLGIYPGPGAFNPSGQFTSIGESGGVPGPTANGCDLYGFRAQFNAATGVSLGIQRARLFNIINIQVPTLSFGDARPLWIVEQGATGAGTGTVNGCGKLLGYFRDFGASNNVFTILGSATASGGTWQTSDQKLKRNIEPINNAIDMVNQLNGYTYEYRTDERPELNLSEGRNYGFITQEVQEVMPEVVRMGQNELGETADYQIMQYTAIIPVLTEAIKEQQSIIVNLEARLADLEAKLNGEESPKRPTMNTEIGVISTEGVSLRQNRPNPFQGETTIDYTIPSEMTNARLVIYDLNGKALSNFALAAGNGQVSISASELTSGVYFYTIENNSQTLARQKMVVK